MPALRARLVAQPTLRPTVSPQLIAQSEILELSADRLQERIEEELASNPALEVADDTFTRSLPDRGRGPDMPLSDAVEGLRAPYTLLDDLRLQLAQVPAERRKLCEYLLEHLDERGFLEIDEQAVAGRWQTTVAEVQAAVQTLQTLEPAGIAARSLRECLLLQMQRLPRSQVPPGAEEFVNTYLQTVRRQSPAEVGAALRLSDQQLAAVLRFISSRLYMWPADCFREDAGAAPNAAPPVTPDAWIVDRGGHLQVRVARSWSRSLRISEAYARLDRQWRQAAGAVSPQEQARLAEDVRAAQTFIHYLTRREAALRKVTEAIVQRQREFFAQGSAALQALTRKEIAAMLHVHESTVSRITRDKYVQLPDDRLVPFDFFFDSSLAAKAELSELIAGEDPAHPLSDAALADLLRARGYDLARRTVAKYRGVLGLAPAHQRKRRRPVSPTPLRRALSPA